MIIFWVKCGRKQFDLRVVGMTIKIVWGWFFLFWFYKLVIEKFLFNFIICYCCDFRFFHYVFFRLGMGVLSSFSSRLNIILDLRLFGILLHSLWYSRHNFFKSWTTSFSTSASRNIYAFTYGATNRVFPFQ